MAYDIVNPEEALWTWDINHHTWQQMHPTGDIPAPDAALGLAVANGCAYLLVKEANTQHSHVGVYEVDLQQWHWRKLPLEGHPPRVKQKLVPVVVQVYSDSCSVVRKFKVPNTVCWLSICLRQSNAAAIAVKQILV